MIIESVIRVAWILCFCSMLPLACQSVDRAVVRADQTPDPAATQLASRVASLLPRRATVSIETRSLAQLPPPAWSNFPSRFQDELRKAGVQASGVPAAAVPTTTTPPEARVRVTLAEDAHGLLLVAEVFTGDNRQVAMLPWNVPPSAQPNPPVSINKKLLWAQEDPILDVLLQDSDTEMLVLGVDSIASYRLTDGKWVAVSTATLALPRPMPRDPRGRIVATPEGFQAFLPAATCTGAWTPELKVTCAIGTVTWPGTPGTRWLADRNVLLGDAASSSFEGWGSDQAAIADPCGGQAIVADSPGNEHDSVRVYQVASGQATPLSDALPLPGPVTALWPEGNEATVVVHNLQTGEYEASRLGVACTQ